MHDGHDIRTNPTSTMRTENEQEKVNAMALTRLGFISLAGMQELFNRAGSATVVMENRHNIRDIIPDASDRLVAVLADVGDAVRRAEAEYIMIIRSRLSSEATRAILHDCLTVTMRRWFSTSVVPPTSMPDASLR